MPPGPQLSSSATRVTPTSTLCKDFLSHTPMSRITLTFLESRCMDIEEEDQDQDLYSYDPEYIMFEINYGHLPDTED